MFSSIFLSKLEKFYLFNNYFGINFFDDLADFCNYSEKAEVYLTRIEVSIPY
jgi:hypothetical protein